MLDDERKSCKDSSFIIYHSSLRILFLRTLGAVFGAAFFAVVHTGGVECAANDGVAHTGQVFHTTAAHQHDGVFLEVVAFAGNVRDHLDLVGQAHFGYLAQSGVRLLGRGGVHAGANATALGVSVQSARLALVLHFFAALAHQLIDGRHTFKLVAIIL